jgi:hypothetical protein
MNIRKADMKKAAVGVLVTSLLASAAPLYAENASVAGSALSPEGVRNSIERATVVGDAGTQAPTPVRRPLSVSVRQQFGSASASAAASGAAAGQVSGGGGGHMGMILTLVGTAASIATAAYYLKIMKKATSQTPSN